MEITVTSLTDHRIDVRFAEYIRTMLSTYYNINHYVSHKEQLLIITNGMYASADKTILRRMKEVPSLYLVDDHTCWVPDKDSYPECTVLCQFTTHPRAKEINNDLIHFPIARLALFDEQFDTLGISKNRDFDCIYWGTYKPERHEEYMNILPQNTTIIGRRYPDDMVVSKNFNMLKFTKNLDELNDQISRGRVTKVFGDKFHNGVNLPYRIYEALMNGVYPYIDKNLLGTQTIDIDFITEHITGRAVVTPYSQDLDLARDELLNEFIDYLPNSKPLLAKKDPKRFFPDATLEKFKESTDKLGEVLAGRASTYGSYATGVEGRASIISVLNGKYQETHGGDDMPETLRIMFGDLALKLIRTAGDPEHEDSWLDLAGYSKLIMEGYKDVSED